jgi:hypothetical protein
VKQAAFRFGKPVRQETVSSQTRDYDRGNLRCADEILANPEPYGGKDGGMYAWAVITVERLRGSKQAAA